MSINEPLPVTVGTYWYVDNIEVNLTNKISEMLDISVTASNLNPCPGDPVDFTLSVCNNIECGSETFTNPAFSINPILPSGLTLVSGNPITVAFGEIPSGDCKIFTFSAIVSGNSGIIGQSLPVTYEIVPDAACVGGETKSGPTISPVYCPPPITCTCPSGGTIYSINPGAGVPITLTDAGIPTNISNACIELNGLLSLNANLTLQNVNIVANPGSRIEIQNGFTLTGTAANFYSCFNMWQGITVNTGGTLNLDWDNNAHPSSISDAQYAILAQNNSNLKIAHTNFDKNYIGVNVPLTTGGSVNLIGTAPFNQCNFTCSTDLLPAYNSQFPTPGNRSFLAFDLKTVSGFNIGQEANGILAISGHRNGLRAEKSIFSIRGAIGEIFGPISTGQKHIGIYASRCLDNTFNNNRAYSMKEGYSATSCSNNYLLENIAVRAPFSNSGLPEQGFFQIGGMNNRYCCNQIDNITYAGFQFFNSCLGTDFQQSQIRNAGTGLKLGYTNNGNSTIIGDQIDKKNCWSGTYNIKGAKHESDMDFVILQSKFKTPVDCFPLWETESPNNPTWFTPGPIDNNQSCNCPPPPPGFGGNGDDVRFTTDRTTANGGFATDFSILINWEAQRNLYDRLSKHYSSIVDASPPSGLTTAELEEYNNTTASMIQFYTSSTSGNNLAGQYGDGAADIELFRERSISDQDALSQIALTVQLWDDSLRYLTDQPSSSANEALKAVALSRLLHYAGEYELMIQDIWQDQITELPQLVASTNQLSGVFDFQVKERELHELYLNGHFWEASPAGANWTGIKTIADLCPLSYGTVVYQARSLYMLHNPDYYWTDEQDCGEGNYERLAPPSLTTLSQDEWVVSPNPGNSYIRFTTLTPLSNPVQLQITNALGGLVISRNISAGTQEFVTETGQLPSGIYAFRINGDKHQTGQFIIQH
jgi:hypothetical protein